jgi:hypothetical protein
MANWCDNKHNRIRDDRDIFVIRWIHVYPHEACPPHAGWRRNTVSYTVVSSLLGQWYRTMFSELLTVHREDGPAIVSEDRIRTLKWRHIRLAMTVLTLNWWLDCHTFFDDGFRYLRHPTTACPWRLWSQHCHKYRHVWINDELLLTRNIDGLLW